ncbi:histidinol-phosphatase HisJ family protein [Virgibacillus halodenitrificans]|uniref:histidinol-phosphatase HisJ family protein n=1 Tax=Virgibacillus halodenitrificans TaxID=1482 RepID=UPI00137131E1|nr:histidinol-phosphatase HisJ family protein [Virgibacillus halodenitrificans]MYL46856.1 histidinol-phosphatase HisJ family protein [Virgibacillus halodenitrificans]
MFDFHIHSNFSADCETPMEKTIEQAIKSGIKEIAFTEHIDYEYPDPSIVFDFNQEAYDKKIKEMQIIYADKIKIKKGIEIGVQPHLLEKYNELISRNSYDFMICSMHTADKKDLHSGAFFSGKTIEEAYQLYYEELLYCVQNYSHYSVLGHLDLVKRYTKEKSKRNFHEIIREIFRIIVSEGKGIELNSSGIRYGLESGMPSPDILKLYKDCGGEIITIGSDSHVESTVGYELKEGLQLLDSVGFKYVATFTNQEPEFHRIDELI